MFLSLLEVNKYFVFTLIEKKKMVLIIVLGIIEGGYKICIFKEFWENRLD